MTISIDALGTLAAAIAVLYLGTAVQTRVGFLRDNNIPVPVVGGLLLAVVTTVFFLGFEFRVTYDMALKEPFMLAFFTTIGLGADARLLRRGGPRLLLFAGVCLVYLVLQDAIGVAAAVSMDLHPLVGLLSGSITLSGGHGTGAAYAQRFSEVDNIAGAMELAMAVATFGLVLGGLIGGPVAQRLIRTRSLLPETRVPSGDAPTEESADHPIDVDTFLWTLLVILLCLIGGRFLADWLSGGAFTLPGFIWSLFIGVLFRNAEHLFPRLGVHRPTLELVGTLSLSVFLAMALMSLRLWELMSLAGPLLVMLLLQVLGMALYAYMVTFRVMGADYDSAVIAGGHCGFGMGATPTAVANMEALVLRYGPSPQAFIVVPLMGAFFIDFINALVIQGYLALPLLR